MNTARPFRPTTTPRARSMSAAATCRSLTSGKKRRKGARAGFINALQPERHLPQGLKPAFLHGLNGTAEAEPWPKPSGKKKAYIAKASSGAGQEGTMQT